jgi:DNA-binding transcriptional regulator YdaS (Cro superfamily)
MVKKRRVIKRPIEPGLQAAIDAAGNRYRLAQLLKVQPTAVWKWWRVPPGRIIQVEQATGVDRAKLRPDLYKREGIR